MRSERGGCTYHGAHAFWLASCFCLLDEVQPRYEVMLAACVLCDGEVVVSTGMKFFCVCLRFCKIVCKGKAKQQHRHTHDGQERRCSPRHTHGAYQIARVGPCSKSENDICGFVALCSLPSPLAPARLFFLSKPGVTPLLCLWENHLTFLISNQSMPLSLVLPSFHCVCRPRLAPRPPRFPPYRFAFTDSL